MAEITVEWREDRASIWREFRCEPDVSHDGSEMAEWIIRDRLDDDPASWTDYDGELEIRAPERFAGTYQVTIELTPRVSATKLSRKDPSHG